MATLIDSSLWVDYFRTKTPRTVKEQVVSFVDDPDAALCEPVRFEILRAVLRSERTRIEETFATMPSLPNPPGLWTDAAALGRACVDQGVSVRSMDLLIAQVCLDHRLEIVTFDTHFTEIAKVSPLKVRLLSRAVSRIS